MIEAIKLILQLYYRPVEGMSNLLDHGSLLFSSVAVLVVSGALQRPAEHWARVPFYGPLFVLAVAFVPGLLLLSAVAGRFGGFVASFRRDYSPLLTCTAAAWAAANLPLAAAAWIAPPQVVLGMAGVCCLYFLVLVLLAIRTVFGASNGLAAGVVCLSWIPLAAAMVLWEPLHYLIGYLASPFFLFYGWYYLGGELSNLGAGMRNRQNFRRMLEASALNPHDAEAQYQLGLVYQQRRNYTEAIQRFQNAVKIDPREADAHFQLGRIARDQGRVKDAFREFEIVYDLDPRHSMSEILRELGGVYLDAGRPQPAMDQLEIYVERRPYDPQGLYYCGLALEGLHRPVEAREMYQRAVEAARTAPRYRRPFTARWSRLAQKQERRLKS